MGFIFTGIPVAAGFSVASPTLVDAYGAVQSRQDLNLPTHPTAPGVFESTLRCIGRTVFVVDEGVEYQLKHGVTDDDWEVKGGGEAPIISTWANDVEYTEGTIIWYDSQIWRTNTTHTSPATPATFDDDKANFTSGSADIFTDTTPTLTDFGSFPVGSNLSGMTFTDYVRAQHYPDIPPTVTFTANPTFALRELGVALATTDLSAAFTKTKNPIAAVEFFRDNTSIHVATITNPNGETVVFDALPVDGAANVTFKVEVEDTQGLMTAKSGTYEFVNPMYIGSVDATTTATTITEVNVKAMTKRIVKPSNQSLSYTITNSKFVIWVPDTWAALKKVLDPNSFDMTTSFESAPLSITNAAGTNVAGMVYVLKLPTSQTAFNVTYFFV